MVVLNSTTGEVAMTKTRRLLSLAVALTHGIGSVSAFSSSSSPLASSSITRDEEPNIICSTANVESCLQRRALLSSIVSSSAMVFATSAQASLLDDYGADPTENKQPKKVVEQAVNKGKVESNMEPNLRSNYYYPTNKVRYLPRIKKCNDSLPLVAASIGSEDWDAVKDFATVVADDTILPMKLYVSSLEL